jgi:pimeloyl-ACP methyl ester carboxylesterase
MTVHALHPTTVDLTVDGVDLSVSALVRKGAGIPVVFLHGFGSTKEDYADFALIQDGPFVAYDAPGWGVHNAVILTASRSRFWSRQPTRFSRIWISICSIWSATRWADSRR